MPFKNKPKEPSFNETIAAFEKGSEIAKQSMFGMGGCCMGHISHEQNPFIKHAMALGALKTIDTDSPMGQQLYTMALDSKIELMNVQKADLKELEAPCRELGQKMGFFVDYQEVHLETALKTINKMKLSYGLQQAIWAAEGAHEYLEGKFNKAPSAQTFINKARMGFVAAELHDANNKLGLRVKPSGFDVAYAHNRDVSFSSYRFASYLVDSIDSIENKETQVSYYTAFEPFFAENSSERNLLLLKAAQRMFELEPTSVQQGRTPDSVNYTNAHRYGNVLGNMINSLYSMDRKNGTNVKIDSVYLDAKFIEIGKAHGKEVLGAVCKGFHQAIKTEHSGDFTRNIQSRYCSLSSVIGRMSQEKARQPDAFKNAVVEAANAAGQGIVPVTF